MIGQRDPITWKGEPDELGISDKIRATKKESYRHEPESQLTVGELG